MGGTDLIIRFVGLDLVSRVAERAGNSIDRLDNRVRRAQGLSAQALNAAGIAAVTMGISFLAAAGGAAALAGHMTKMAMDFQSSMVLLVNHANFAKDAVAGLSQYILQLAPTVGIGPQALADAFYHVQSSITSLPKSLQNVAAEEDILAHAAQLAQVGHADLTDTTNALLSVMTSYAQKNYTAAQAVGILNTTVGEGNMKVQDLVSAFRNGIVPVAAEAGVSLQSLGASLATLTDLGIPATRAATYLRSAIIQMTMPSGPAVTALKAIGLSAQDAGAQANAMAEVLQRAGITTTAVAQKLAQTGSLADTMQFLQQALDKAGLHGQAAAALLERAFGGIRSGTGVVSLVDNLGGLIQKEKDATEGGKNFAKVWQYFQTTDPNQAANRLRSGLEALEVTIGNALIPDFLKMANILGPLISQFIGWANANQKLIQIAVPAFIAIAGAIGLLLVTAGGIMIVAGSIGILAETVGAIAGGVGALEGLGAIFGGIASAAGDLGAAFSLMGEGDAFLNFFTLVLPELGGFLAAVAPVAAVILAIAAALVLAKDEFDPIVSAIHTFQTEMRKTHDPVTALMLALKDFGFAGKDAQDVAHGLNDAWKLVQSVTAGAADAVRKGFNLIVSSIPSDTLKSFNQAVGQLAAAFVNDLLPVLEVVGVILAALIGGAFQMVVNVLSVTIPAAVRIFTGAFEIIAGVLNLAADWFRGWFQVLNDLVHGRFSLLGQDMANMNRKLWDDLKQIWQGIKDTILGLIQATIGAALVGVTAFVDGFLGVLANLPGGVGDKFRAAKDAMDVQLASMRAASGSAGSEVGAAFSSGLAIGISDHTYQVMHAAAMAVQMAKEAADAQQNSGSPSRLMRDTTGKWFSQGYALGIGDSTPMVAKAAQSMVLGSVSTVNATLSTASAPRLMPVNPGSQVYAQAPADASNDEELELMREMVNQLKAIAGQTKTNSRPAAGVDSSNLLAPALQAVQEKAARGRLNGMRAVFAGS